MCTVYLSHGIHKIRKISSLLHFSRRKMHCQDWHQNWVLMQLVIYAESDAARFWYFRYYFMFCFIWTLNNGMNGIPLEICFFWWMILLSWWIFLAASNEIAGGKNPYFMSMLVDSPGDAPPQKENTYITRTSRTKKAPVHHSYDHILLNRIFSFLFESWNMDKRDQCIQIIQHFPNEFCC